MNNHTPSSSTLVDSGLDTMIQFYATQLAQGIKHSFNKISILAARCDDPRMKESIEDASENYDLFMELIKLISIKGVNVLPDDSWSEQQDMMKYFFTGKDELMSQLNDQTKKN